MAQDYTWRETLDAIRHIETGSYEHEGRGIKGDHGNAYGPYQIWLPYWTDSRMDYGTHALCLENKPYSELVVKGYMLRYAKKCTIRLLNGEGTLADVERVSRIHNGGPKGYTRISTRPYWEKIQKRLDTMRKAPPCVGCGVRTLLKNNDTPMCWPCFADSLPEEI